LAVSVALSSVGCGDDFDPYSRLNTFRVLALQSEPAAPGPGETAIFSAFLFRPADEPVTYAWSWCPFPGSPADGYPCLTSEAELTGIVGPGVVPPFDLGTGETATLTHTIPPQFLQQLCAGVPGAPARPDCDGGFPVQLKVTVATPDDEITAIGRVRLRFDPATPPNANPRLDGMVVVLDGTEVPVDAFDQPAPTVTVPRDRETVIRVGLAPEAAEPYSGPNDDGQVVQMRERLTLSWFAESGGFDEDNTAFIDGLDPPVLLDDARQTAWTPGKVKDYPGETSRIVVVIRDNRGGVGWVRGRVRLGAAP
jgi:hypothetical protein